MRIGIDVSQLAYDSTGVANYLSNLVFELIKNEEHEFILFFSSMRGKLQDPNSPSASLRASKFQANSNVKIKRFKLPPTLLDLIWNKLHILPIENFIGNVDVFITSDWTEPPSKHAKKATIIYDLIVLVNPDETDKKIVSVQKRKLKWVKKESDMVFCISKSTKSDIVKMLNIDSSKVHVIYPGL